MKALFLYRFLSNFSLCLNSQVRERHALILKQIQTVQIHME